MNLRYILAAGILVAGFSAHAAVSQRSAAVGELAAYCVPASRPASHDIVFMPDGTSYALAIFVKDFKGNETEAAKAIARISSAIYSILNTKQTK